MARFSGTIGYVDTVDQGNGVHKKVRTERTYRGTITRTIGRSNSGDKVNADISVENNITIVADAFAREKFYAIKYVIWSGVAWSVSSVQVEHPRLILQLGEVYSGTTGSTSDNP